MTDIHEADFYSLAEAADRLKIDARDILRHGAKDEVRLAADFNVTSVRVIVQLPHPTIPGKHIHHELSHDLLERHGIVPCVNGLCYLAASEIGQILKDGDTAVTWVEEITPSQSWPKDSRLMILYPYTVAAERLFIHLNDIERLEAKGSRYAVVNSSASPAKPRSRERGDLMYWEIHGALEALGLDVNTPSPKDTPKVMRYLKEERAGRPGCCITEATSTGVKWVSDGIERPVLDIANLRKRMREWNGKPKK